MAILIRIALFEAHYAEERGKAIGPSIWGMTWFPIQIGLANWQGFKRRRQRFCAQLHLDDPYGVNGTTISQCCSTSRFPYPGGPLNLKETPYLNGSMVHTDGHQQARILNCITNSGRGLDHINQSAILNKAVDLLKLSNR